MTTTTVYVSSLYGVDAVGNGTFLAPYATINYTMGQITPTSGTPYIIFIGADSFVESSLALKPHTNIIGNSPIGTTITISSGNLTLDASWAGATSVAVLQNIAFISSTGINFDFTTITGGAATVDLINIAVDGNTILNGRNGLVDAFTLNNCLFDGNFTGNSASFIVNNLTNFPNSTTTFSNTGSGGNNLVICNDCLFNCTNLDVTATGSNSTNCTITNSENFVTNFVVTGTNAQLRIDATSYSNSDLTFSGGATFASNVTLLTEGHGMFTNHTPVNYTTTDNSITSNIAGIDAQLGSEAPAYPIVASKGGTGVASPTAHTLPVAEGSSAFNFLGPLTNGQLLIGSTSADPVPATITAGAGINIANAAGSITIAATNSGDVTAVTGVSPIASSGGATPAISLNGTSTPNQVLMSATSTTTAYSTSTYPSTTTINQLLYSSGTNTVAGLTSAGNGVLVTSSGGVPSIGITLPLTVQSNITEVGTIASGIWNGTDIPLSNGGTNANLTANAGGVVYSTSTGMGISSPIVNIGSVLQSNNLGAPSWSSATYPSSTTANQLLYSSSSDIIAGITTLASAVLTTNSSGVPSWTTTLPSGIAPSFEDIAITNTTNQIVFGTTNTVTLDVIAPASSRTYSVQDAGGAADVLTTLYPGTNSVTWTATPITFNSTGSSAMNFGTGSYSGTLSFGNTTGPSTTVILGGVGICTSGASTLTIGNGGGASTTAIRGNVNIGDGDPAANTTIGIVDSGSITVAKNLNIGNNTATPSVTTMLGTITVNNAGSNAVGIGIGSYSGTVSLGNASSTITALGINNINTTGSSAVNIASTSYSGTVSIGNASATVNMLGGVSINNGGSVSTAICTGSFSGILGIGNASATVNYLGIQNINTSGSTATNIGTSSYTGTVTIGNTSATAVAIVNNTQLVPKTAGVTAIGTTALPYAGIFLGTAATNNYHLTAAASAAARTYTLIDGLANCNIAISSQSSVTQATGITTGVTITGPTGNITTVSLSTGASAFAGTFVVTNTFYTSANQVITVTASYGSSTTGTPYAFISARTPGSNTFAISVASISTTAALNGTLIITFTID